MLLEIGTNRLSTDSNLFLNLFLFHPFVAQRQLAPHLNAEGTLENENPNYSFLRMVRRAKKVATLFCHRNPVNHSIRHQIEQTLSDRGLHF